MKMVMRDRENFSWDIKRRCLDPLVQVEEDDEKVVVTADLPCVKKEDIELFVEKDSLTIKAKTEREIRFDSWGGVHRKYNFNCFRKSVSLPAKVEPESAEAEFKNRILTVTLDKKKAESIKIK